MERRGHPKPKITHTLGLRVAFQDRGYACKWPNGSLKPGCRRLLYCPDCDAKECLFGGLTFKQIQAGAKVVEEGKPVRSQRRREAHSRASKRSVAEKRAQGLTPRGEPLRATCWNCGLLRRTGCKFICELQPLARPVTEWCVRDRLAGGMDCQSFGMRLVMEIPGLGVE